MATMKILEFPCTWLDCTARATRSISAEDGSHAGNFCSRHANSRLVELAKEEGQYGPRPTEKVKAVKA